MPRKQITWKEIAVKAIAGLFKNHFWKLIGVLIVTGVFISGIGISTCKGTKYETNINVNPALKSEQKK